MEPNIPVITSTSNNSAHANRQTDSTSKELWKREVTRATCVSRASDALASAAMATVARGSPLGQDQYSGVVEFSPQ